MWEDILKASYSSRHFKELKVAVLKLIGDLDVGKEYFLNDLILMFPEYYTPAHLGRFGSWWKEAGPSWLRIKFGAIATYSGKMERGERKIEGRKAIFYIKNDPNKGE